MLPLSDSGLIPRPGFPAQAYEVVQKIVHQKVPEGPSKTLFVGSWMAMSFRFDGMLRDAEVMHSSVALNGPGPGHPHRSQQEHTLFSFYGAAVSAFESFRFAMFAVGAHLNPAAFPITTEREQRAVNSRTIMLSFESAFPGDPMITALGEFDQDSAVAEIIARRNLLTHRVIVGRHHCLHAGADWGGLEINDTMLEGQTASVTRRLDALVSAAATFVQGHL